MLAPADMDRLGRGVRDDGYAVAHGDVFAPADMADALASFQGSWDALPRDLYMPDRGFYRFRRYGRFRLDGGGALERLEHAPFFQSRDINSYAGGFLRDFAPLAEATFANPFLERLIRMDFAVFTLAGAGEGDWDVQIHQIRIETPTTQPVSPTPEGLHRDGHDYLAMHLMRRENAEGGESLIVDADGRSLGGWLLARPLDSLFIDDRRVAHQVTQIWRRAPENPARRDMLLVDFDRRRDA